MNLKELADHAMEKAKELSREGQQVEAAFLVVADDKLIIAGMRDYAENKAFCIAAMKAMLEHYEADRYAFVSEAWMSVRDKDGNLDKNIVPSKDPNRIEAIVVTAKNRTGEREDRIAEIKRHGHKVTFKDLDTGKGHDLIGVTDNLFGELGRPN